LPFKVYHERGTFSVPPPAEGGFSRDAILCVFERMMAFRINFTNIKVPDAKYCVST